MAITNQIEQVRNKQTEVDAVLDVLKYNQIDSYIDSNITSLASAKEYLKKLSKIVLYIENKYSTGKKGGK
jgi:hypothetical protein